MSSLISTNTLHIRSLLSRDDTPSNFICARPKSNDYGIPLSIGITFKSLMAYITPISLVLTAISTLGFFNKTSATLHGSQRAPADHPHCAYVSLLRLHRLPVDGLLRTIDISEASHGSLRSTLRLHDFLSVFRIRVS